MEFPGITVRKAEDSDLHAIARDYGPSGASPFNPFASVDRLRQLPREGLLVAEVKEKYAGFLYWYRASEIRSGGRKETSARIVTIRLKKNIEEEKVAGALLHGALKDIDKADMEAIVVDASGSTPSSVRLFERLGFYIFDRTFHMRYLYPADRKRKERPRGEIRELAVFMVEVREQCRMFSTACLELQELISRGPPSDLEGQRAFSAKVWFRIQAALSACAIISKIMWPNPTRKKDDSDSLAIRRALRMRHVLNLYRENPFPVAVRNAFEHVDARLAEWLPLQEDELPWGWSLSPYERGEEPRDSGKAFRYFNLKTWEVRVADATCNLRGLVAQVRDIERHLPEEAQVVFRGPDDLNRKGSAGRDDSTEK